MKLHRMCTITCLRCLHDKYVFFEWEVYYLHARVYTCCCLHFNLTYSIILHFVSHFHWRTYYYSDILLTHLYIVVVIWILLLNRRVSLEMHIKFLRDVLFCTLLQYFGAQGEGCQYADGSYNGSNLIVYVVIYIDFHLPTAEIWGHPLCLVLYTTTTTTLNFIACTFSSSLFVLLLQYFY